MLEAPLKQSALQRRYRRYYFCKRWRSLLCKRKNFRAGINYSNFLTPPPVILKVTFVLFWTPITWMWCSVSLFQTLTHQPHLFICWVMGRVLCSPIDLQGPQQPARHRSWSYFGTSVQCTQTGSVTSGGGSDFWEYILLLKKFWRIYWLLLLFFRFFSSRWVVWRRLVVSARAF